LGSLQTVEERITRKYVLGPFETEFGDVGLHRNPILVFESLYLGIILDGQCDWGELGVSLRGVCE